MAVEQQASTTGLKPTLGVAGLTIFGIGNMLGAGIYGLVGKAAGLMGNAVWLSFLAAVLAAGCTGLTYASLGSRYPRAGGAAFITERTFRRRLPAYIVGLTVGMSGLVSMAAGSHTFVLYLDRFLPDIPTWLAILGYVTLLGAVNAIGMKQSVWLNTVCTVVETFGLVLVIAVGIRWWGSVNYLDAMSPTNPNGAIGPGLILGGAALTFYAFIGFEDVLNVSEEVKNPQRTIPIAVILAVSITMLIYMAVAITAVSVVPAAELADTKATAPLALVVERAAPWIPPFLLPAIAMFAVSNTGLLNYIMSSRLVYGMSRDGLLPRPLSYLHPKRRTPQVAIAVLGAIVLALALPGSLGTLATATSLLLLSSFIVMNTSMIILKYRPSEPRGAFEVPVVVPMIGIAACGAVIVSAEPKAIALAGWIFAGIVLLCVIITSTTPSNKQATPVSS